MKNLRKSLTTSALLLLGAASTSNEYTVSVGKAKQKRLTKSEKKAQKRNRLWGRYQEFTQAWGDWRTANLQVKPLCGLCA